MLYPSQVDVVEVVVVDMIYLYQSERDRERVKATSFSSMDDMESCCTLV